VDDVAGCVRGEGLYPVDEGKAHRCYQSDGVRNAIDWDHKQSNAASERSEGYSVSAGSTASATPAPSAHGSYSVRDSEIVDMLSATFRRARPGEAIGPGEARCIRGGESMDQWSFLEYRPPDKAHSQSVHKHPDAMLLDPKKSNRKEHQELHDKNGLSEDNMFYNHHGENLKFHQGGSAARCHNSRPTLSKSMIKKKPAGMSSNYGHPEVYDREAFAESKKLHAKSMEGAFDSQTTSHRHFTHKELPNHVIYSNRSPGRIYKDDSHIFKTPHDVRLKSSMLTAAGGAGNEAPRPAWSRPANRPAPSESSRSVQSEPSRSSHRLF